MSDQTTSYAKTLDISDYEKSRLDQAERLGLSFDKVGQANNAQENNQADRTTDQSSMVESDRPQHNMRPPEDIARPVDRENFNQAWKNEQNKADSFESRRAEQLDRLQSQDTDNGQSDQYRHTLK